MTTTRATIADMRSIEQDNAAQRELLLLLLEEYPGPLSIEELEADSGDPHVTTDAIAGLHRFGMVRTSEDGRFWSTTPTVRYLAALSDGVARETLAVLLEEYPAQLTIQEVGQLVNGSRGVIDALDELEKRLAIHCNDDCFWPARLTRRFEELCGCGCAARMDGDVRR